MTLPQQARVNHVVLLWFDKGIAETDLTEITAQAKALMDIPGVRTLQVGPAIHSDRKIVDDSFHLGLLFQFDSRLPWTAIFKTPPTCNL